MYYAHDIWVSTQGKFCHVSISYCLSSNIKRTRGFQKSWFSTGRRNGVIVLSIVLNQSKWLWSAFGLVTSSVVDPACAPLCHSVLYTARCYIKNTSVLLLCTIIPGWHCSVASGPLFSREITVSDWGFKCISSVFFHWRHCAFMLGGALVNKDF